MVLSGIRANFVQDVAYNGTKTLKLSNGEEMEIPNLVRTVIASEIVDSSTVRKPVSFCLGGQPCSLFYTYFSKQSHDSKSEKERKKKY